MRIAAVYLCGLLLAVCGVAGAQSQAVALTYGTSGGTLTGGAITTAAPSDFTRLIQGGTVLGDVAIRDGVKARVGSVDVNMVLDRRMPWHQITKAAAAIGRTIPYVATGIAFIELMDQIRLRSDGGGWNQDPGVPRENLPSYCFNLSNSGQRCGYASAMSAITAAIAYLNTTFGQCGGTIKSSFQFDAITGENASSVGWTYRVRNFSYTGSGCTGTETSSLSAPSSQSLTKVTQLTCPASIDALNPANSIPAAELGGIRIRKPKRRPRRWLNSMQRKLVRSLRSGRCSGAALTLHHARKSRQPRVPVP